MKGRLLKGRRHVRQLRVDRPDRASMKRRPLRGGDERDRATANCVLQPQ
jgi:hypothetical protein